ncbi:alpha/beta hydrolase family protein [Mycobacterium branderi]|uniref:Alpha/beta hydrolase n=1 Tax=Mycobacterium branderi TaxID=43348 RepID=A0A7I7W2V7_9MYCO|nr:alpha/beta hydrolase family protein [Mycobacterium branderi]MCV7233962.1 alpha/beta hydrolase family protein [Mycobacterium branderi]ORA39513.1 alpha/beta hydrolase [Mycobacterium branderi]BBZ11934.1 alpha/beta hydrolase [Mycobacterium branderi]
MIPSVSKVLDAAVLAVIRNRQPRTPPQSAANRTVTDMLRAAALFEERGWLVPPAAYHRRPPPLHDADITAAHACSWPAHHETLTFPSGFSPRDIEPGADRWVASTHNDTVLVRLLRHREPAPWVVCLHGFGMGATRFDLTVLWATVLHRRLGFNVAVPVLPLHGPRRSAEDRQLLSLDLAMTLHGISQAIWDTRRLVSWIRSTSGLPVGVYGLSLGGYLAALLAGVERLDAVVAGLPFADVLGLMAHHGPPPDDLETLRAQATRNVFTVVSPLAMTPLLPVDRRAIFAARDDRLIPADQPIALQGAWQDCQLYWYNGGHVGFAWSRQSRRFVADRLHSALCARI